MESPALHTLILVPEPWGHAAPSAHSSPSNADKKGFPFRDIGLRRRGLKKGENGQGLPSGQSSDEPELTNASNSSEESNAVGIGSLDSKLLDDDARRLQREPFKVGFYTGTSSEDLRAALGESCANNLGRGSGVSWRLIGEEGEDLVVSAGMPSGTYRLQWKPRSRHSSSASSPGTLTPDTRRKKSLGHDAQEIMDEVVEKVMATNENNIFLVLLNFSLAFIMVVTVFTKIHTSLPSFLSTCIGNDSHKKAKALYSCMRTHIGKNNNTDHTANLYGCAVEGNLGGVFASVCHWFRVEYYDTNLFLFGFNTPEDLQNIVYESVIGAVCWGVSYLWIRRGMNPETRKGYYKKYWKDAVYGSLAGFNGTFMKGVLKQALKNARSS